jgi:hypothetical protein
MGTVELEVVFGDGVETLVIKFQLNEDEIGIS